MGANIKSDVQAPLNRQIIKSSETIMYIVKLMNNFFDYFMGGASAAIADGLSNSQQRQSEKQRLHPRRLRRDAGPRLREDPVRVLKVDQRASGKPVPWSCGSGPLVTLTNCKPNHALFTAFSSARGR